MKYFGFAAWGIVLSIFMFNMHPLFMIGCASIGLIAGIAQRYVNKSEEDKAIEEEKRRQLEMIRNSTLYSIKNYEIEIEYKKALGLDYEYEEKTLNEEKEELKEIESQLNM